MLAAPQLRMLRRPPREHHARLLASRRGRDPRASSTAGAAMRRGPPGATWGGRGGAAIHHSCSANATHLRGFVPGFAVAIPSAPVSSGMSTALSRSGTLTPPTQDPSVVAGTACLSGLGVRCKKEGGRADGLFLFVVSGPRRPHVRRRLPYSGAPAPGRIV